MSHRGRPLVVSVPVSVSVEYVAVRTIVLTRHGGGALASTAYEDCSSSKSKYYTSPVIHLTYYIVQIMATSRQKQYHIRDYALLLPND